ncbi:POC1 centriolar protein A [Allomyces javanicus]|nr:POC1 centriolar protein A [Allomyces javanicus]
MLRTSSPPPPPSRRRASTSSSTLRFPSPVRPDQLDSDDATDPSLDPTLDRVYRGHKTAITAVTFRAHRAQLASGSADGTVMVWNGKKGLRHFCFTGHKRDVTAVHFAPRAETNLLASSSLDKTVKLWTPSVKGDATTLTAHTAAVRTVRFSPDSQSFLTCSDDKTIKLWSTSRTKYLTTLSAHTNWVRTAVFHPVTPTLLASGSDDQSIRSWDLRTSSQSPTHVVPHVGSYVLKVAMHATRPALAASTAAGAIHVYDTRMWRLVQHYPAAHGVVRASNVAPLATAARGAAAADGVHDVALDEQGSIMVSAGGDGLVKCWDLSEGRLAYAVHGHDADGGGVATAVAVSGDGGEWASGGADAQVLVWRWPGGGAGEGDAVGRGGGVARWGIDSDADRARRPSTRRVPVDTDGGRADAATTSPHVPPDLAATLATVVAQLDVLTATMAQLDRRLTMCEDRVNRDHGPPGPAKPRANGGASGPAAGAASNAAAVPAPEQTGGPRAASRTPLAASASGGT